MQVFVQKVGSLVLARGACSWIFLHWTWDLLSVTAAKAQNKTRGLFNFFFSSISVLLPFLLMLCQSLPAPSLQVHLPLCYLYQQNFSTQPSLPPKQGLRKSRVHATFLRSLCKAHGHHWDLQVWTARFSIRWGTLFLSARKAQFSHPIQTEGAEWGGGQRKERQLWSSAG